MSDNGTANQRKSEWAIDAAGTAYHMGQWLAPKQSTRAFARFTRKHLDSARLVLDLGCGAGAATAYLAHEHPDVNFEGLELSAELVSIATRTSSALPNLQFQAGDWYDLQPRQGVDGVISLQTLSWLPEFECPMQAIFQRCAPQWIAISSLFYQGEISCRIEVTEHLIGKSCFYNVYSIPRFERFCREHGYALTESDPFEIDIDLPPPPTPDTMGTYTVQTVGAGDRPQRLQISGPLLMNWRFLMIERLP